MPKDHIQQACDRIFDASPLAVNFVQKVSTHHRAVVAPQGTRDQQWLPKQAATGLFKVGLRPRPPPLKASGRRSVSYMDMFGKKANKSSDSSFELVSKSDKRLSSRKQSDVPPQTSNDTRVECEEPYIPRETTTTTELDSLPGRYGLKTRERSKVGGASEAKPEKNIKSKLTTKSGPVESSLNRVKQNKASQDDDDDLSNHSEVESERSSDEEEDINSKLTTKSGPVESSLNRVKQNEASQDDDDALSNHSEVESERSSDEEEDIISRPPTKSGTVGSSLKKVTEQSEASQGDDDVDSLSNHSEVESEGFSEKEEEEEAGIQSNQTSKRDVVKSSLNKSIDQTKASQDDDDLNCLSNQGDVESETSSDDEEDNSKPTNLQNNTKKIDNGPVDKDVNCLSNHGDVESERSSDDEEGTDNSKTTNLQNNTKKIDSGPVDKDVNCLSNHGDVESERSSDDEEGTDNSKTTNLQNNTKKIDNGPVDKDQIKRAQSRMKPKPISTQETVQSTFYTKPQPAKKEPEQRQSTLTVLRLGVNEPVETPKTVRGSHSRALRQRGSESGYDKSQLTKSTIGSTSLKSTNDSLNRCLRSKGRILDNSRHKKMTYLKQKGSEKDPLVVGDLPKTRSGRRVLPPLAWWAGQRVFVHPHGDILEIKPPTPSNENDALSASMMHFKDDVETQRSKQRMSRKLLAGQQKSKTSLNKSDTFKKKSLTEGSCHQTCRQVKVNAHNQNSGKKSGDESQSGLHSVSTPLSRNMPMYKSDGVCSEEDALEKFDTPGFPQHLRNPPAARSRANRSIARTLDVGDIKADDLCRSFGNTPIHQLVKKRSAENRKKRNQATELEEETLIRKAHEKKSKLPTTGHSEARKGRGRPKRNIITETISNQLTKTHQNKISVLDHKRTKRDASPVDCSGESDTGSSETEVSCSDDSDEEQRTTKDRKRPNQRTELKEETLLRKAHQKKSTLPTTGHSEARKGRGRPKKNISTETISNQLTKTHQNKISVLDHKRTKRDASPVDCSGESDTGSSETEISSSDDSDEEQRTAKDRKRPNQRTELEEETLLRKAHQKKSTLPTTGHSEARKGRGRPKKNISTETISNQLTKTHQNKISVLDHKRTKRDASPVDCSGESDTGSSETEISCSGDSDEEQRTAKDRKRPNQRTELEEETLLRKAHQNKSTLPTTGHSETRMGRGRPKKNISTETISNQLTKTHQNKMSVLDHKRTKRDASPITCSSKSDTGSSETEISCSDDSDAEWKPTPIFKYNISKNNKKVASHHTEDNSGNDVRYKPAKRQRGKVASSNEWKKAKVTKAQHIRIYDDEGQAKKKVYPADLNSKNEPQAPSKTKAKVFKNKENVHILSSSESLEDIWDSEEITLYKQSLRQLNPSMDNFWYHVHLLVETKTAQQCQAYHQRCAPLTIQKKKPAPPTKVDNGQKPGLTGKTGTLKRKRELKSMLEELNHNHEDDFFDATPVRQAKKLKLPTQDDEDDDDFYQNRPNTETPLSSRFTTPNPRLAWMPSTKTPVTSVLSPSITNTVDRKNTEVYVHRLLTKRHKRLPVADKIVEEQEPLHPETPKAAGSAVFQTLFKKDTPQEVDSEVEEDYYFSDSN